METADYDALKAKLWKFMVRALSVSVCTSVLSLSAARESPRDRTPTGGDSDCRLASLLCWVTLGETVANKNSSNTKFK